MGKEQGARGQESGVERSGRQIQSVQRAIQILNCFTATNTALTLSQISHRLQLNKGTAHGILHTLCSYGYVMQNHLGQYLLGPELFYKACLAPDTRKRLCMDHGHHQMQELSNRFQANGTLFSVEDGRLLLLDTSEPTNCEFIIRRAAPQSSLYGSASGKIVLAYLPKQELESYLKGAPFPGFTRSTKRTRDQLLEECALIRTQGYSTEINELYMGVSSLSVPIFHHHGTKLFGTMSLTGMTPGIRRQRRDIIEALQERAEGLQRLLRF